MMMVSSTSPSPFLLVSALVVLTVLTATLGSITTFAPNLVLAVGSVAIFAACIVFLARRSAPVVS